MIIRELHLYCQNLIAQKRFYTQTLGFELINETATDFKLKIGDSMLQLEEQTSFTPYHFAFGIPFAQYRKAHDWLGKKLDLLGFEGDEIIDFPAWDAKALYFYDADQNICEFIARKSIEDTEAPFSLNKIENIVEIGLVTRDIQRVFDQLHSATDVKMYDGSFDRFLAIGDDQGLFICVNPDKKQWFPTDDEAHFSDFKARVEISQKEYWVIYRQAELTIQAID